MFVDADDKLDPQMLSVLRAMLGQTESDLAVCDYYRWNGKPDGIYNRSEELLKMGYEAGVFWQSGKAFHGEWYIRMNLALPNSRVREAFDRLDKYVFNA